MYRMFFLGGKLCPVLFGHLNLKNLKTFSKKPRFFPALVWYQNQRPWMTLNGVSSDCPKF